MQLSSSTVSAYLEDGAVSDRVDDAIKSIHQRLMGVKLKDISEYEYRLDYNSHPH
jgi:hypothetical protein